MNGMIEKIRHAIESLPATQTQDNREALKRGLTVLSPELANPMLDYVLERTYLEDLSTRSSFVAEARRCGGHENHIEWLKFDRLPVPPGDSDQYDLLTRWQAVLTSLHAWKKRMLFLLMRKDGVAQIYIGIVSEHGCNDIAKFYTSLINNMPGIEVSELNKDERQEIQNEFLALKCSGAVTGIPSFRKNTRYGLLQTLDRLAFGVRRKGQDGEMSDADFAFLVVADPMDDAQITDTISRFRELGSQLHTEVRQMMNETESTNRSMSASVGIGALFAMIVRCSTGVGSFLANGSMGTAGGGPMDALGGLLQVSMGQQITFNRSLGKEYLNKFAEHSERLTDTHCRRLCDGRSLGFWNTGIYVMATRREDVLTVLGMLRSIYSGDETYLEPIRIHDFGTKDSVIDMIRRGALIPILNPELTQAEKMVGTEWHVLGRAYQYASTPLNTEELSLATSLPRKDVPGLRLVRNAVRFANNSGAVGVGKRTISLGRIKDTGVKQSSTYVLDVDSLVRHALVTGGTGCGKTTTCRRIISKVQELGIPILVIEPTKDEWARWAVDNRINLFMPGVDKLGDCRVSSLKLNPFQPGGAPGAEVDMLTHCEQLTAIVNASLPTSDVLPVLIDESFFCYLNKKIGTDFLKSTMAQLSEYPSLDGVLPCAKEILKARGYDDRVERGLAAALETRFSYLTRGKRGSVLNVRRSTPWQEVFGQTAVVNLSRFSNPSDRALIMSLLMLALREYRQSVFENDPEYKSRQEAGNPLAHLTVIEEAHTVLAKSEVFVGSANPQAVVADIFGNMLSEIRGYGEGMMIVDQVPTRLIPDAIKNTNLKIAHRMASPDDCAVMSAALGLRPNQGEMLPMLEQGEAIAVCDRDDAAAWVAVEREVRS